MAGDATLIFGQGRDRWRSARSSGLLAKIAFCAGASALVLMVIPATVRRSLSPTSKVDARAIGRTPSRYSRGRKERATNSAIRK